MKDITISDSIRYIGADDKDLDLFEGQYVIPNGISYNSYVIIDEKIAVLDTIDARRTDQWVENLKRELGDRQPDYLVVSHMEPDHSYNVKLLLDMAPQAKVVCTAKANQLITRFFGMQLPSERTVIVKDGDTLSLGQHTLQFFTAPMVHWPEVMMEYEQKEKILFAADAFGKFGALDDDDQDGWACEARRYYFNIVGKYGAQVQAVLKNFPAPISKPSVLSMVPYSQATSHPILHSTIHGAPTVPKQKAYSSPIAHYTATQKRQR